MLRRLVLFVVAGAAAAAASGGYAVADLRSPTCGCDCGTLVDADGRLNMDHCDAARVLRILDRYARSSSRLLPERVEPADLEILHRKLERLRREAVRDFLEVMSEEELDRFLPMLTRPGLRDPDSPVREGTWPGRQVFACQSAVVWINKALDRLADVEQILLQFFFEQQQFGLDPGIHCDPELVAGSSHFIQAQAAYWQARDFVQAAADAMTAQQPALAKLLAYAGWWRSFQAGFGFMVAFNAPPVSGDARCAEIAQLGLSMIPVGQAAKQGYEWADTCAGSGGFF